MKLPLDVYGRYIAHSPNKINDWREHTTDENMEYLEGTVETLVFDILFCWKWFGTSFKQSWWL